MEVQGLSVCWSTATPSVFQQQEVTRHVKFITCCRPFMNFSSQSRTVGQFLLPEVTLIKVNINEGVNQGLRGSGVVFHCSALNLQQMAEEIKHILSIWMRGIADARPKLPRRFLTHMQPVKTISVIQDPFHTHTHACLYKPSGSVENMRQDTHSSKDKWFLTDSSVMCIKTLI